MHEKIIRQAPTTMNISCRKLIAIRECTLAWSSSPVQIYKSLLKLDVVVTRHRHAVDDFDGHRDGVETGDFEAAPPLGLDLRRAGIRTIVWATGFRPDYSWLQVPVLDPKGNLRHDGGVVSEAPGLYVMGLPFLRRRKSSLIDGVGDDARDLSAHLASHLDAGSAGA
jgi:putative flavoprotein involved in K+ transport